KVDVVGEEHQIALAVVGIHPTCRIGDQQRINAQRSQDTDRKSDFTRRVALVQMKSPLKRDDGYAAKPADEQPPVMRFHGRQRKVRDVVVRKYDVRVDLTGEFTETRP